MIIIDLLSPSFDPDNIPKSKNELEGEEYQREICPFCERAAVVRQLDYWQCSSCKNKFPVSKEKELILATHN
jgi:ribosomal protein L37AE/L43A